MGIMWPHGAIMSLAFFRHTGLGIYSIHAVWRLSAEDVTNRGQAAHLIFWLSVLFSGRFKSGSRIALHNIWVLAYLK